MYPTCGFFISNRVYLQRFLRRNIVRGNGQPKPFIDNLTYCKCFGVGFAEMTE